MYESVCRTAARWAEFDSIIMHPKQMHCRDSSRAMLEPGDRAPAFTLPDQNGEKARLSDLKGQTVVLYFYPRADTPRLQRWNPEPETGAFGSRRKVS